MNELDDEKKFYERFYALHRNPKLVAICKEFGIGVFRLSSVLEGFEDFIKETNFSGGKCVEIGTRKGLTAIVLAGHFKKVVTIDIVPDSDREKIAAHVGVKNIQFIDVPIQLPHTELISSLSGYDAAYVDGDHAQFTEADFNAVRKCGRVLFHEYWEAQPKVWNLVNRLRNEGRVKTWGKFALWTA